MSTAPDRLSLRAFMGAFQTVFDQIEAEIAQMGEDWFIETCASRLIPYIGDLVGVTDLGAFAASSKRARARWKRYPLEIQKGNDYCPPGSLVGGNRLASSRA